MIHKPCPDCLAAPMPFGVPSRAVRQRAADTMTDGPTLDVQVVGRRRRTSGVGYPLEERENAGEQAREYISPQSLRPRTDPRYGSKRWRHTAKAVLVRDNHVCRIVEGCVVRATVCDHVIPVYPGMPDSLFFGMDNLRAGCQGHNKARGMAPEVPLSGSTALLTKDYTR